MRWRKYTAESIWDVVKRRLVELYRKIVLFRQQKFLVRVLEAEGRHLGPAWCIARLLGHSLLGPNRKTCRLKAEETSDSRRESLILLNFQRKTKKKKL